MADYRLLLSHVKDWEGGLSAAPNDTCASHPSSYLMPSGKYKGYPVHTNKGICFSTWQSNAPKLGFDPSSNGFIKMTDSQWASVINNIFWKPLNLDKVHSQKIAELIFEVTWGSGFGGSKTFIKYMQKQLSINDDGVIGDNTIKALNNYTEIASKENSLYEKLWNYRRNWLNSLASNNPSKYAWALGGWMNRLNALYSRAKTMVGSNTTIGIGVVIAIGLVVYSYFKLKQNANLL